MAPSTRTRSRARVQRHIASSKGAQSPALDSLTARMKHLTDVLGSQAKLADWLEVSRSQPSRWTKGLTTPSTDAAEAIANLDFITTRAALVWDRSVVPDWLRGHNAFLGGATPLEMIRRGRTAEVLQALEAEASGAYA
jgi:DNA-binding transcriptional regulator YdaS (Cro superfamily)